MELKLNDCYLIYVKVFNCHLNAKAKLNIRICTYSIPERWQVILKKLCETMAVKRPLKFVGMTRENMSSKTFRYCCCQSNCPSVWGESIGAVFDLAHCTIEGDKTR